MRDWPGARIGQDNVIWKPPGTKPLGFHQDDSYNDWIIPGEMLTCWIALDDTRAYQGTIEHVRGSHKWPMPRRSSSSMRPMTRSPICSPPRRRQASQIMRSCRS